MPTRARHVRGDYEVGTGPMGHDDIERFDRWAPRYDRSRFLRSFLRRVQNATVAAALAEIARPARVLDVGCGTGLLLRRFGYRFPGAELFGVDPAPGMIREARRSAPPDRRIEFLTAPAEALPLPDGHFDLVLTTISFHHWRDQAEGLRQVRRVLVPGGVFALADPLRKGLLARLVLALQHGRFHTPASLDALLQATGLAITGRFQVPGTAGVLRVTLSRAT